MSIFDGTHRAPNNRESALSFGGTRYEPKAKLTNLHWDICPPIERPQKGERDLTGMKQGRLTVVGKAKKDWIIPNARWIVRCSCGDFELRKSKSILNPENGFDKCHLCRARDFERKNYEFRVNGVHLSEKDF